MARPMPRDDPVTIAAAPCVIASCLLQIAWYCQRVPAFDYPSACAASIPARPTKKAESLVSGLRSVFPGTGVAEATPVHSTKSHREALAEAIDPEIAWSASISLQPRREGCVIFPQS